MHEIVIPKLMTLEWLKQLYTITDLLMTVSARLDCWSPGNFEQLMIAIGFPFLTHRPYELKDTPKMLTVARNLCSMFQKMNYVLRKFLLETWGYPPSLPEDMV